MESSEIKRPRRRRTRSSENINYPSINSDPSLCDLEIESMAGCLIVDIDWLQQQG